MQSTGLIDTGADLYLLRILIRVLFTGATAWIAASFAVGIDSMESELHNMHILSLWAVGVFPFGFSLSQVAFSSPFARKLQKLLLLTFEHHRLFCVLQSLY